MLRKILAGTSADLLTVPPDDLSLAEDSAFGVLPGDPAPAGSGTADADPGRYRLERLEAAVGTLAGRAYPVWVAGVSPGAVRIAGR